MKRGHRVCGFQVERINAHMIQRIQGVIITGKWFCETIEENIQTLLDAGYQMYAVVSDK